jgi:hypothetical protein
MSLNRYAKRRDANEPELVGVARQLGAQLEQVGPLDWWLGWKGNWKPVEIKTDKGKYTEEQILFMARCKEHGNPHLTWRTVDDVLASLNARQTA